MRRIPPATAVLLVAGISPSDVAAHLGRSPSTLSRWLSGATTTYPPELLQACTELGGAELARQVAEAIPRGAQLRLRDAERHAAATQEGTR